MAARKKGAKNQAGTATKVTTQGSGPAEPAAVAEQARVEVAETKEGRGGEENPKSSIPDKHEARETTTVPMDEVAVQRDRTIRVLLKRLFEAQVQRYLESRNDHNEFFSAASPISFKLWSRVPRSLGRCGNPWHFPAYEIFLDCARLLCDHMTLYGLGQFLIAGVDRGNAKDGSAHMQIIECFWRFQDAAVTYNVLCSLTRVLRWFMVDQVHGNEVDESGRPLPKRHTVDTDAALRWAREAQESTTLVWFLFERAASALIDLFEANMVKDYRQHCDAIHNLVRIFIHAVDHPIVSFGLAEILVLYDLFLQETPDPQNRYAVESKLSHVQSFDRKFWAYKHPTFGQLIEADMYHEHLAGRSKIALRQLDPPEDSWLLAPDQAYANLQKGKLESLMKKAHAIGKSPMSGLVHCSPEDFATALKSDCDFALGNAVETITELQLLRIERYDSFLEEVGFPLLVPLLEQLTELGESSSGLDDGADVEPALVLRIVVALWVNRVLVSAIADGKLLWAKDVAIRDHRLPIRFLTVCLASNYDDIVEAACLSLIKYFEVSLSASDRGAMVPLVVDRIVAMLDFSYRGMRTTHVGLTLLSHVLRLHGSFDVPNLPEIVGLVAKVTAPVMLGGSFDNLPMQSNGAAFSDTWCPSGSRAELDELSPLSRRLLDDAPAALSDCILQLIQRDASLLGACFVKQSGLHALIGIVGKTRATEPEAAGRCLTVLGRLVAMSVEVATGLICMDNAVMLLTVCANLGDESIRNAAVKVIEVALDKLPKPAGKGGAGKSADKKEVAKAVFRMALEHDTAKCVIENMSMLMMTHEDKALTALEYSFQDTLFFKKSFEKAREVMRQSGKELGESDAAKVFPSYLEDVDRKPDLLEDISETRVALCASCGAPEVDVPHRFCDVAGVFCSADCQKQHFDALQFGSSTFKMKANETLVSQALELQ